ncbi:MAG: archaemetzincin [Pyrinomonadaceae bacterium]
MSEFRIHPVFRERQIKTGFFLDKFLPEKMPDDAAALICFTNYDLYPNENFNFVFGQASLKKRVGVWSLKHLRENGDSKLSLRRVLKTGVHETGHMFSIEHCTKYKCVMNGTNGTYETDSHPADFCPVDTAKVLWATRENPGERFKKLSEVFRKHGLKEEADLFLKKAEAVRNLED